MAWKGTRRASPGGKECVMLWWVFWVFALLASTNSGIAGWGTESVLRGRSRSLRCEFSSVVISRFDTTELLFRVVVEKVSVMWFLGCATGILGLFSFSTKDCHVLNSKLFLKALFGSFRFAISFLSQVYLLNLRIKHILEASFLSTFQKHSETIRCFLLVLAVIVDLSHISYLLNYVRF